MRRFSPRLVSRGARCTYNWENGDAQWPLVELPCSALKAILEANATMGIRFYCPNGCKVHVKAFQAGRRGICPHCGVGVDIPLQSTRSPSKKMLRSKGRQRGSSPQEQNGSTEQGRQGESAPAHGEEMALAAHPEEIALAHDPTRGPRSLSNPPPVPEATSANISNLERPLDPPPSVPNAAESRSADPGGLAPQSGPSRPRKSDPLEDPADVIWYVRPPTGGQYGPAGRDVMRTWLAEGRITPDSQVWREGWRDWKEAIEVFPWGLFPQLRLPDGGAELDRLFEAAGPPAGIPGGPYHPKRYDRPQLKHILFIAILVTLGVGILAALYLVTRYLF